MSTHAFVSYEEFIERANRAKNEEELVTTLLDTVKQHGMDKVIFCLLSDHQKIGLSAGVGYLRNYPKDWMDHYFEQGYDQLDPVISYCYERMGTFSWEEMEQRMSMTRDQKKCLNLGVEAGLNNGICTPLWGPHRFAGVGMASSEKKDTFDGRYDLITAYCNHFYLAFQRLHDKNKAFEEEVTNIYLTPREKEVLLWVHKGKSDTDISDILTLSSHSVNFHLRNIFKKLGVNHRILATTKAVSLGLIHP